MPLVDILLATYNGAKYLPEQLASLEAQTHADWRLIVRDDGSGDGSLGLVRDWATETGRDLIVLAGPMRSVEMAILLLAKLQRQAQCFHDAFGDRLEESDRKAVLEFATLQQQGLLKRKTFMIRHGVCPQAWLRRLVLICLI